MDFSNLAQFLISGLTMGSIYALVALGFTIIYNASDVVNFLQGEFVMIGAMCSVMFVNLGIPYFLSFIFSVLVCFMFGILFERSVIYPAKSTSTLNIIIITIGASILTRGIAMLIWGKDSYTLPAISSAQPIEISGVVILTQSVWILLVTILLVFLFWLFYTHTFYGRAMKGCADNRTASAICGIESKKMIMYSFGISALLGGIAGVLIAPITLASYDMGLAIGLKGFAASMLGGIGVPSGAIMGGFLLGILEAIGAGYISSHYKDAIAFLILLIVLFIMPQGLFGRRK